MTFEGLFIVDSQRKSLRIVLADIKELLDVLSFVVVKNNVGNGQARRSVLVPIHKNAHSNT